MSNGMETVNKNKIDLILGVDALVKQYQLDQKQTIEFAFTLFDGLITDELITLTNANNSQSLIRMHKSLHIILSNPESESNKKSHYEN